MTHHASTEDYLDGLSNLEKQVIALRHYNRNWKEDVIRALILEHPVSYLGWVDKIKEKEEEEK